MTDCQVPDSFLVAPTPWESCGLTWSVQMPYALLQFPSFTAACQRLVHKSRPVCRLLTAESWKKAPVKNDWIRACTCSPLKLPNLVFVVKKKAVDALAVECCMDGEGLCALSGS